MKIKIKLINNRNHFFIIMSDDISLINLNTDTIDFLLNKMKIKIYLEILNFINTEDNYLYFTHLFIYFFKEFKDLHKIFYIDKIINNKTPNYQELNKMLNLNRNSSTFKTLKTEINKINEIIKNNDIITKDIQPYLDNNLDKLDYNIFILLCDIISDKNEFTIDKVIRIISKYVNIKEFYQKYLYQKYLYQKFLYNIREDDKYNQFKYHKDLIHIYMYSYNLITNNNLITKKEYLRVIKIILKCIFLTNYIDINYSYAMTCINIYLYKMHELSVINNNNKNKALIILALLARLLLQTNTFYLNNYTNYLQIQTSNIRYTNKNINIEKIKEIIEYQEGVDTKYEIFISNIRYFLINYYNIYTFDNNKDDMKEFIYTINNNINKFNNLKQLILLILVLKYISINIHERYKKLQKQIITFIQNIKIYVIMNNGIEDTIKDNINEIYSTLNKLLYSELDLYIKSNNLSSDFINIIQKHYINTYFVNIDIIYNEVIILLPSEDDMNNFKILYYLIKIIDIIDINNYSLTNFISIYKNIFDKIDLTKFKELRLMFYNNYCKNYPEKISYINNYNIKGGADDDINDDINDKIQLLETNEYKFTLKDPTYLLNHIPMFNCKRIILIRFITTELTSKKIKK
jgi:hypothetical protein